MCICILNKKFIVITRLFYVYFDKNIFSLCNDMHVKIKTHIIIIEYLYCNLFSSRPSRSTHWPPSMFPVPPPGSLPLWPTFSPGWASWLLTASLFHTQWTVSSHPSYRLAHVGRHCLRAPCWSVHFAQLAVPHEVINLCPTELQRESLWLTNTPTTRRQVLKTAFSLLTTRGRLLWLYRSLCFMC